MQTDTQHGSEGLLDRSFEDLVTKILATEDDCPTADSLSTQLTLTQELLDNLAMGNCFENGVPPMKQSLEMDINGLSSAQLIQEALSTWMRQNRNLQESNAGGMSMQAPFTPERQNGDTDFCNPAIIPIRNTTCDKENVYSGMGSPCTSVTGSYSSGDEVGWSSGAFGRGDTEIPSQGIGNNPPMALQPKESSLILDMKVPPQNLNSQVHFEGLHSPTPIPNDDQGFFFPPNRASPNRLDYKKQNPTLVPKFPNNNPALPHGHASPTCHTQRPVDPYAMNGYPSKMLQPTEFAPPPVSGHGYNFPRGNFSKFQQRMAPSGNNYQPKIDAHTMAGFPRNNYNNRFPRGSHSQVPTWLKHNPPPNLKFQQNASIAQNYNSFPNSPTNPPPPMPVGEFAAAIEECQCQLQNLEKERRKTETELVKMNPGKRISSSNTIAVPPLPPNPSSMDQLINDQFREHSRMTTLLSKIGGLNAKALHPNIEMCLDKWMSAIQAVEAHRTSEICQNARGKVMLNRGDGSIVEKIRALSLATVAARTKLWCALALSKEKHVPPMKKELLNFLPQGVRLI